MHAFFAPVVRRQRGSGVWSRVSVLVGWMLALVAVEPAGPLVLAGCSDVCLGRRLSLSVDGRVIHVVLPRSGDGAAARTLAETLTNILYLDEQNKPSMDYGAPQRVLSSVAAGHRAATVRRLTQAVLSAPTVAPSTVRAADAVSPSLSGRPIRTLSVIWQIHGPAQATLVLQRGYLAALLRPSAGDPRNMLPYTSVEHVVDTNFSVVRPNSLVVYDSAQCEPSLAPGGAEGAVPALFAYLERFDRAGLAYGIVHMNDERRGGCRPHYPMARAVLRNIGHPSFARPGRRNVVGLPMGYLVRQPSSAAPARLASRRRYVWSFAGDTTKSNRAAMVRAAVAWSSTSPGTQYFLHETSIWRDPTQISREAYGGVLGDTVFALCPIGNFYPGHIWGNHPNGLGSLRFWEAVEHGAIPVLENLTSVNHRFGASDRDYVGPFGPPWPHALPLVAPDWRNLGDVFAAAKAAPGGIDAIQRAAAEWYAVHRQSLGLGVRRFVGERLWGAGPDLLGTGLPEPPPPMRPTETPGEYLLDLSGAERGSGVPREKAEATCEA